MEPGHASNGSALVIQSLGQRHSIEVVTIDTGQSLVKPHHRMRFGADSSCHFCKGAEIDDAVKMLGKRL